MQNFVYALIMVNASYRQAIQKKIRDLDIDITFEMLQVMRCLIRKDNVNQKELANQVQKDKSSLSYLLNNMEKRNLISRIEDKTDKRYKLITITRQGKTVHDQIRSAIDSIYTKVDQTMDSREMEACIETMKEISAIVSNE